nr:hypothetical protein [Tanacetum cinerariifolium]
MVAILEKSEHNINFHPMVDFVEASPLRRNLKLQDEEGISSLHDTELFETLTLMGYNISPNQKFTFQKGTPTEPHHTPSQEAQPSSHTHISSPSIPTVTSIPTIPIPTVIPSETTPIRQYTRRARIAQSSTLPPIADEPASYVRDISQGEACPTDSGFIADQDRATITNDVVPTASPVFATATVVTLYRRKKGKEVMVESETPKKQKLQEQIDAQIANTYT